MNRFYERQIKRIKERLDMYYSNDEGKSQHYFHQKGYLEGLLNAYESFVDNMKEMGEE